MILIWLVSIPLIRLQFQSVPMWPMEIEVLMKPNL